MENSSNFSNQADACVPIVETTAAMVGKITAYVLVQVVGLTGNILVLYVVRKTKQGQRNVNFLIINMVVSDLVVPVFVVPRHVAEILLDARSQWLLSGLAGQISCKVVCYVQDTATAVSTLTVVLIGCERLVAVVFPLHVKMITAKPRVVLLTLTWIVSALVHAPYLYTFKLTDTSTGKYCIPSWEPEFEEPKTSQMYLTFLCVFLILVPFTLLSAIYATIVWKLVKQEGSLKHATSGTVIRDKMNRNVLKMALAVTAMFAVCWAPLNVYNFIVIFVWNYEVPICEPILDRFRFVAVFLCYTNSAVNPCLYFVFVEHYRRCVKNALKNSFLRCSFQSAGNRLKFRRETFELTSSSGDKQTYSESSMVSLKRARQESYTTITEVAL